MPDECRAFSELRQRYLALMRQVIDKTDRLLKSSPAERDAQEREAHRAIVAFAQLREQLVDHRKEHPVHAEMREDLVFVLADLVVTFCRDGATVQMREAVVVKIPDKDLVHGLIFASEQWLGYIDPLVNLIDRIEGQTSERGAAI